MRKRTLNNQGVALVTVVLFFLVLVILLGGVMFSSISNQKNAMLSKEHSSAYYVAESGLNVTMEKLKKILLDGGYSSFNVGEYDEKIAQLTTSVATLNGQSANLTGINPSGTYTISTSKPTSTTFLIRSTGVVDGVSRTVQTTFEITPVMEFGKPVPVGITVKFINFKEV